MILGARELLTEGDGLSNLQPESSYPIGYVSRNFGMLIRAGLDRAHTVDLRRPPRNPNLHESGSYLSMRGRAREACWLW